MKKLARNLLSVALIAALVLSLGVVAFAAEKDSFEFKIDLPEGTEIEDVILRYVQDGTENSLSVKKVLGEKVYNQIGGAKVAEAVAFDRFCNDLSDKHIDEETTAGKGTVTFPAAPEGGIECPDMIQIPVTLLKEGNNYVAYVICIGIKNGTLLTADAAKLANGVLGDRINLGNVAVKDNLAKVVISPDAINALGAQNGDTIRVILGLDGLERSNDHTYQVPKIMSKPQGGGDEDPDPAPGPQKQIVARHGISFRSHGYEIGLEARPIYLFGFKIDRVVFPYMTKVEDNGKTELDVHAGIFRYVFDLFDPLTSFLGYLK